MAAMAERPEHPLAKLANAAFVQVTWKVIERAEQTGTPVIVWENGRVTKLDPETVRARLANQSRAEH